MLEARLLDEPDPTFAPETRDATQSANAKHMPATITCLIQHQQPSTVLTQDHLTSLMLHLHQRLSMLPKVQLQKHMHAASSACVSNNSLH